MKFQSVLLILCISFFFPFSILKCEILDSLKIDTSNIDSTDVFDSTKSLSQSLHEKFDTAYVGTNAENIKGFIRYFRLSVGYGYHYQNDGDFPKTNGTLWNISLELMLDKKRNWSFELALYQYMFDKYSSYITYEAPGKHYIFTSVFKRYFPYFGKYIKPAIFAGGAPIPMFLGGNVGVDLDFMISKIFQVKASYCRVWQWTPNFGGSYGIERYSPFIVNLKICFIPDF